jgi:TonB-dependent Receptor Plug Domain
MKGLYLFALVAAVGCASGGTAGPGIDRNVITESELRSVPASNLYELIEKVRPNFLRSRGASSISMPGGEYAVVYLDGRSYGDLASLRSLIPSQVSQVRYYDASTAASRFGMISATGVIDVASKQ